MIQPDSTFMDIQCLWDASMAYSIADSLAKYPVVDERKRPLVLHICGRFHMERRLGMVEDLVRYADLPGPSVLTLAQFTLPEGQNLGPVLQNDPDTFQALFGGRADYVALTGSHDAR